MIKKIFLKIQFLIFCNLFIDVVKSLNVFKYVVNDVYNHTKQLIKFLFLSAASQFFKAAFSSKANAIKAWKIIIQVGKSKRNRIYFWKHFRNMHRQCLIRKSL